MIRFAAYVNVSSTRLEAMIALTLLWFISVVVAPEPAFPSIQHYAAGEPFIQLLESNYYVYSNFLLSWTAIHLVNSVVSYS
jgi:hypothetical protein